MEGLLLFLKITQYFILQKAILSADYILMRRETIEGYN